MSRVTAKHESERIVQPRVTMLHILTVFLHALIRQLSQSLNVLQLYNLKI